MPSTTNRAAVGQLRSEPASLRDPRIGPHDPSSAMHEPGHAWIPQSRSPTRPATFPPTRAVRRQGGQPRRTSCRRARRPLGRGAPAAGRTSPRQRSRGLATPDQGLEGIGRSCPQRVAAPSAPESGSASERQRRFRAMPRDRRRKSGASLASSCARGDYRRRRLPAYPLSGGRAGTPRWRRRRSAAQCPRLNPDPTRDSEHRSGRNRLTGVKGAIGRDRAAPSMARRYAVEPGPKATSATG
jgi:hypothetical protein